MAKKTSSKIGYLQPMDAESRAKTWHYHIICMLPDEIDISQKNEIAKDILYFTMNICINVAGADENKSVQLWEIFDAVKKI